ncbi:MULTISPECIES: hypothetical protein [unclassified Rhizobium]
MRISALESDRGYESYFLLRKAQRSFAICLFGANVNDVITADEEEGFVLKCLRDPNTGRFIVDQSSGLGVQFKLRGPVQILVK